MAYPGPAFREDRREVLHAAIEELAFGMMVTHQPDGFATSYLPFEIDAGRGPGGTLIGHLARYNPQSRVSEAGAEALVVFQGPHAYVSPSWYPGKRDDPRQVPTWDYLIVEARGVLTTFDDEARLLNLLNHLTEHHEAARPNRWRVSDAPEDYVHAELRHIIGIELRIESLVGRYKLSQNRKAADQEGARAGLAAASTERERDLAKAIAAAQRERRDR
ncbi:MAG TPA: FMN-binding negative transcriptional regulator [Rhodanobacteraceae bacterium]|jgi:transcriptional regulator|nr:FMN-binding negative transcriptional regulator [Rhodanobacteraceae bacterium]